MGQKVRELTFPRLHAGLHSIIWNGTDDIGSKVASGVYLYQITSDFGSKKGTVFKKIVVIK